MQLQITPEVFALFPQATQYTLITKNLDNTGECQELLKLLRQAEAAVRADDSFADIKAHPFIASWREAFKSFGINPNQCPPSVANLIKRTRAGKDLPFVNKLVCIFNIISLKYVLPAGGDDVSGVTGNIILGPARGDEKYIPLGGGIEEVPKPGEVILYDEARKLVFCRAWCWKNGDTSKIMPESRTVSLNIDVLPPASSEYGQKAAEELMALVKAHCHCDVALHRLDVNNPAITFEA